MTHIDTCPIVHPGFPWYISDCRDEGCDHYGLHRHEPQERGGEDKAGESTASIPDAVASRSSPSPPDAAMEAAFDIVWNHSYSWPLEAMAKLGFVEGGGEKVQQEVATIIRAAIEKEMEVLRKVADELVCTIHPLNSLEGTVMYWRVKKLREALHWSKR